MDNHQTRNIQDEWERALERACENEKHKSDLDAETLNDAAGLHVQSGVRGGWTGSCSCQQSCGCHASIDIC